MRVTPDCDSLNSFYISQAANAQYYPDIAFGGGIYMVVWTDNRAGHPNYRIYGARVSTAGTVLDPNGIMIGPPDGLYQTNASIVYNGMDFFVVWCNRLPPYRVLGCFIDTLGVLSDTIRINDLGGPALRIKLALSDTNYMAAWVENSLVRGQILSLAGTPFDTAFTIASPVEQYSLGLHYDGFQYCITYALQEDRIFKTWGRKYDLYGHPIGGAFQVTTSANSQCLSDFIPGAQNQYLNVWTEDIAGFEIYGNLDIPINGISEKETQIGHRFLRSSLVVGPLMLPAHDGIRIYDVSGRITKRTDLSPGIYFIEEDGLITCKIIKIR